MNRNKLQLQLLGSWSWAASGDYMSISFSTKFRDCMPPLQFKSSDSPLSFHQHLTPTLHPPATPPPQTGFCRAGGRSSTAGHLHTLTFLSCHRFLPTTVPTAATRTTEAGGSCRRDTERQKLSRPAPPATSPLPIPAGATSSDEDEVVLSQQLAHIFHLLESLFPNLGANALFLVVQ